MKASGPFYEKAKLKTGAYVDHEGSFTREFNLQIIPNVILIDADGSILYEEYGSGNLSSKRTRKAVETFIQGNPVSSNTLEKGVDPLQDLYRQGATLLRKGKKRAAAEAWLKLLEKEPSHFIARKQLWRLRHPEKFLPKIDYRWQWEQIQKEKKEGIRQANPLPEDWQD